jgi:ABC-type Fe3+-hydroxamate transport system substrate-binding protein
MKIRHALAVICAAAVLALTACTSTPDTSVDNPATTTVIETADATPTADDMTQTIVDLSWDQQTEADKNAMCNGLALFGTEWGADQMRAVLVEQKCAQR